MHTARRPGTMLVPTLTAAALLACGQNELPGAAGANGVARAAASAVSGVTWTIQEAAAGTIDATGLYVAPGTAGTYHVVATSVADPTKSATAAVTVTAPSGATKYVGVNLGWVNSSQPDQLWANAAKEARPWTLAGGDTLAPLGADGWPTVGNLRLGISEGAGIGVASGYKLRFRGKVTGYSGSSGVTVANSAFDGTYTTADVTLNSAGAWIEFVGATRSDGTPGLTELSLMRPGHGLTTDYWNKTFLANIANISAFRTMSTDGPGLDLWGGTVGIQGNRDTTWSTRTLPGTVGYCYNGPAWEDWVIFANLTGKDVWINIPFHVDADYVTKLGYLLRYGSDSTGTPYTTQTHDPSTWTPGTTTWYPGLMPGRRIYVEYSNELWNGGPNGNETISNYNAEIAAGDPHHLNWDGNGSADRWVAWKTVWISNLLRVAWGSGMQSTIRMVFPTQGDWGGWTRANTGLSYVAYAWGATSPWATIDGMTNPKQPVNYYIRTVAGSFYIHWSGQVSVVDATTAFQSMNGSLSGPTSESNYVKQRIDWGEQRAAQYGITFSGYEAGTEITTGLPSGYTSWWYSDARMKQLLKDEMSYFYAKPHAEVYIHFMMLGNGTFGLSPDYTTASTSVRWGAVNETAQGL